MCKVAMPLFGGGCLRLGSGQGVPHCILNDVLTEFRMSCSAMCLLIISELQWGVVDVIPSLALHRFRSTGRGLLIAPTLTR
jgi:hypothetical protein